MSQFPTIPIPVCFIEPSWSFTHTLFYGLILIIILIISIGGVLCSLSISSYCYYCRYIAASTPVLAL